MNWILYVLGAIGYLTIGALIAGVFGRVTAIESDTRVMLLLAWPVLPVLAVIVAALYPFYWLAMWITHR